MIVQTHTIRLCRAGDSWVAVHSDPKVFELFGTDTLPTAYPADVPAATVLREIQALNMDCRVFIG